MRTIGKVSFAATALILLVGQQLHASEASYITLTCDGRVTSGTSVDPKGDPITKVGVVVNAVERSVSFNGYVVPITKIDSAVIMFEGRSKTPIMNTMLNTYVSGTIDRVTGAIGATTVVGTNITTNWELYCKPASRMF